MNFKSGDLVIRKIGIDNYNWEKLYKGSSKHTPKRVEYVKYEYDCIVVEGSDIEWYYDNFELYNPEPKTITLVEEYKQTLIQIEQLQSKAKTLLEEINKASK